MKIRYLDGRKVPVGTVRWHPAMMFAHEVVDRVFRLRYGQQATLTGAQEDAHGKGSLHYGIEGDPRCRAADYADDPVPANDRMGCREEIMARLGSEFDVVWEARHLHVEYQPEY